MILLMPKIQVLRTFNTQIIPSAKKIFIYSNVTINVRL